MQRRLVLDSIINARDLGGCLTATGKPTRFGAFIRADHAQVWSETTRQQLIDYGVRLIIDLRAPHELQAMPNSFASSEQITYLHIPMLTDEIDQSPPFQALRFSMTDNHEMYDFMLQECKEQIGKIFTAIATHNAPTLFHCYAGKDRTGLVAAILLSLADAEHDAIVHDYTLTGEYLAEHIAKQRVIAAAAGMDLDRFDLLFASTPQTMVTTLQNLEKRYGSIPDYLRICGVSDEHINQLRTMLMETE